MADVVIVGAGIVGASVAYHAARLGAAVTLIDSGLPASGVTGRSFAWIGNAPGRWPGGSEDLRGSILDDYRQLESDLADVKVRWTGSLSWSDELDQVPGDEVGLGPDRQVLVSSDIAALEPHLLSPPKRAVYIPTDAGVDPAKVTNALVQAAGHQGAHVILDEPVLTVDHEHGRVVGITTTNGRYRAGTVVLAAGTAVPALCAPLGLDVPVTASPALVLHAAAPAGMIRTVVSTADFEAREVDDGRLVMTAPVGSDTSPPALADRAAGAVERLASAFEGGHHVRLLSHELGLRPMPKDQGPILGGHPSLPGLYLAVMHSAVCLGPTVGRLAAEEILGNESVEQFARCRVDRFET